MRMTINELRKKIRKIIKSSNHYNWQHADDETLMLDKEGMEASDRKNVSNYLEKLGLKK